VNQSEKTEGRNLQGHTDDFVLIAILFTIVKRAKG
jgi:hypothetical protein